MHLRGKVIYDTWEEVWNKGYQSPYFQASYDDTSEMTDWSLSERQLFTQSNGRTLLGQDTMGRLHFLCTPHDKIYGVPSGGTDVGGQFKGHIGQYYQNDTALLLGKMRYEIELVNGLLLQAADQSSQTWYLDHFLPVTSTKHPGIETKVFSLAPVSEKESRKVSDLHPLPGPAGACYCIEIRNTSGSKMKGRLKLSLDQKFVNQFEHYGKCFEDYALNPYRAEWDQKLLILWHPEGCAAIQLLDGVCEGDAGNPRIYLPFELEAGERKVFTTIVAVTPERKEIHEALGILYQHTPLEWINVTAGFWQERFGTIETAIREDEEMGQKYRDMHLRFILDNFNCLSFNARGRLLTNWQGAPSHSLSRLWGIDIEPDVVSVMYAVPEVGRSAMEYLAERNEPRYSLYTDHSMFFFVSPLVIAGKYLEMTGDEDYFRQNYGITEKLKEFYQGMKAHKHEKYALFSSHYASDLIVFNKYDYGANVKCFYALRGYRAVLKAIGESYEEVDELLEKMPADMAEYMEGDGPFGRQITGGSNMGEGKEERFYTSEELYYYGGEDTSTALAPLYGLYEWDYEPYVNLHRYARSLFITNYDPEYQTMRELHFGMNPSATGCTLRLGGSYTRNEMLDSLKLLYDRLDETGSLFWWPRASNKKRCLTRCSQGQGAWVQHSMEQWFGIRLDGVEKILTIRPQGLLTSFELKEVRIGGFCFDICFREHESSTEFYVKNRNDCIFQVVLAARPYGAGAEGKLRFEVFEAGAKKSIKKSFPAIPFQGTEAEIVKTECGLLGESEGLFGPYGIVMPKLYTGECNIFLLRFVMAHLEEEGWKDVEVAVTVPDGWKVCEKKFYHWEYQPIFEKNKAVFRMEELLSKEHGVAGFYVSLPDNLAGNEESVMLSSHPFQVPYGTREEVRLLAEGGETQELQPVQVVLTVRGKVIRKLEIPVIVLDKKTYRKRYDKMYHG